MDEQPGWRRYLRIWGPDPMRDVDDELSFHIEQKREALRAAGVPSSELESVLARQFGDRRRIERELREIGMKRLRRSRRASRLEEVGVDVRHAWRSFRRRPGVPVLVVLMLSLGIGSGTALFTLVDAVVLNPVRVEVPANLLVLEPRNAATGAAGRRLSYPMLRELNATNHQHVQGVAGRYLINAGTRVGGHAEQTAAALVTGNYFELLGVRPQRGRLIAPADDDAPGASPYAVVSEAYWRRVLGGDPDVIGRTIHVNEATLEIVGVAASRFRGTELGAPVDLWLPLSMLNQVGASALERSPEMLSEWTATFYEGMARIRAGSTAEAGLAELTVNHNALQRANWPAGSRSPAEVQMAGVALNEAAAGRSRDDLLRFLRILAAVVVTCLAVACVNVANLLLIRSKERTAEMSVRAALGGSRVRLLRQLMLEGVLLALAAGVAGAGVAVAGVRLLGTFSLPGSIALESIVPTLDLRVLGVSAVISLVCAVAFGLAPALAGARTDVMATLRQSAHGRKRGLWRGGNALVSVQVALTLVLLVSTFLFVRSLQEALAVDLGYRSEGIASLAVGLEQHGYDRDASGLFVQHVLATAAAMPGIHAVAAASRVPIDPAVGRQPLTPAGRTDAEDPALAVVHATPGYLELMGIPLRRGRGFADTDVRGAPRVAILTEEAARRVWPDEDPLGRQFVIFFGEPWTVVGIVADAHLTSLSEREPHVFLPLAQAPAFGQLHLIARGDNSALALAGLRSAVRAADSRLPTFREARFADRLNAVLMPQRFGGVLLGAFGLIALLISAVGIYAVAAYEVAARRRELGIRAALGADAAALSGTVLARTGIAVAAGAVAGLALAAAATRSLRGLVFGIATHEPISYIAAAAVLALIATAASWVPARRAARVDPLTVIRE